MNKFPLIGLVLLVLVLPVSAAYDGPHVYSGQPLTIPSGDAVCAAHGWGACSDAAVDHQRCSVGGSVVINCTDTSYTVVASPCGYYPAETTYLVQNKIKCGGNWYTSNLGAVTHFDFLYNTSHIIGGWNSTLYSDFVGVPTEGTGPLNVEFTDTSQGLAIESYNWTITPATGWYVSGADMTTQNLSAIFTANGNYTISHGITRGYSSDIETKTDYIWIYNSSSVITTPFTAIDLAFGHPITGAAISLEDIQNSSWANTSSTGPDGKAYITTLATHRINGYATALGFDDADLLDVDANANPGHTFYMTPVGYTNVSDGNVTAFISVVDYDNYNAAIPYASVTALWTGLTASTTASAAGIAHFVLPNNTDVIFSGTKSGYSGNSISLNTGIPSGGGAAITGTIYLSKYAVTYSPTPTTLPGGGTPTTIQTLLPGCLSLDDTSPECQAAHNEYNMGWLSINAIILIQVAFIMTILYIMGWKP